MITGIAHSCFVVSDLERSIEFYRDKLGLTHAFDFKDDKGVRHGAYLTAGGRTFIELFKGDVGARAEKQSFQHICLEVDDIQATAAALKSRGVEVGPVTLGGDQSWQAWFSDPDGNRFELHQYTDKSWQAPHLG